MFHQLRRASSEESTPAPPSHAERAVSYPGTSAWYPRLIDVDIASDDRGWPVAIDATSESTVWHMTIEYDLPAYEVTFSAGRNAEVELRVAYGEQDRPTLFEVAGVGGTLQYQLDDADGVARVRLDGDTLVELPDDFAELQGEERRVALLTVRAQVEPRVPLDTVGALQSLLVFDANVPRNPTTVALYDFLPIVGRRPIYEVTSGPLEPLPQDPFPTDRGGRGRFEDCCRDCGGTTVSTGGGFRECQFGSPYDVGSQASFMRCMDRCSGVGVPEGPPGPVSIGR